ncbi:7360_t:CDS:1 [Ambispora gerdemannii]|uniref:7360_t:CDS:1 n=1 Tax=Ambispora gerdemannii TaxID=144530 RepID=A0A9N9GFW9_9GLOM|nr:7360_t:CDS:1 [Ambispora gerdemannii]
MGNVLAYSAPEQQKYKWPSVIGFNLIIFGIYGYTLYQQKQEQAKIENFYQQKTQEICEESNITKEEWKTITSSAPKTGFGGYVDEYSIFSTAGTEIRVEQIANLKQTIQTKEATEKKEAKIKQQAAVLAQATEIEAKLKEAQSNLGTSGMTWGKIKQRYPEFASKSRLLAEFEKADRILTEGEREENKSLTTKLERIAVPSTEEQKLLTQLYLTTEQFIVISQQTPYLTREEKEAINDNYLTLNSAQKFQLLNSGLNNLGINTEEKKQAFVNLNHTLYQEKANFGLTVPEKENILRFLMKTLDLTTEQKSALEDMGIKPYNASEWQVSAEQSNHLLKFGLEKVNLTEEQKQELATVHPDTFPTFPFTDQQKNILKSLAPLTRKDKYSAPTLELLNSLSLKTNNLIFFTNAEILPNPNLDFGENPDPYLPLKTKFLSGEQKILRKTAEQKEKQISQQELQDNKQSILNSLLDFAET